MASSHIVGSERTMNQFDYQSSIKFLNDHGIYELPEVENEIINTIQLLINNNEGNNGINFSTITYYGQDLSIGQKYCAVAGMKSDPCTVAVTVFSSIQCNFIPGSDARAEG